MVGRQPRMASELCEAMKEAGIKSAKSQGGINFCTDKCPYAFCIIAETNLVKKVEKNDS